MAAQNALILDFDEAVLPLPGSRRLALHKWQESVRYGCSMGTLAKLESAIHAHADFSRVLGSDNGASPAVFLGSGDFHHVSHLLIRHCHSRGRDLQVVVFDNHPDNMRYPFGIHCGSWVWHVSRLPFVRCVHVVGITSADVQFAHAWENHLRPLRTGKLRYWCVGGDLAWMKWAGIAGSSSFSSVAAMLDAFNTQMQAATGALYVSIDKDVLAPDDARTNWDQGVMRLDELTGAIRCLRPRIVGSDVTGEVSVYRYRSWFKRLLSAVDAQPEISPTHLQQSQAQHQALNRELLDVLKLS